MKIRFGYRDIEFPSRQLGQLRDSQHLLGDAPAIWQRLDADGYLLLREFIARETVLAGRQLIMEQLQAQRALAPDTPLLEGVMPRGGRTARLRSEEIVRQPAMLNILEYSALFDLFEALFGEAALTFTYKWMRAVGNDQYTGAHYDFVYMGRGSRNLYTVWIPFGDIPIEQGTLAVCRGSHNLDSFARIRETYGNSDVDRDGIEGWFERDPMQIVDKFGGQWLGSDYRAGDVIIFGMHTMHASTTNLSNKYRLSCDVRYQPASEAVDARWKKGGTGHYGSIRRDMKTARAEWGL
ncbi:MAG: phytanoyl-CoA dioxygenase family protein [Chloroflexi bacterium]|nr:phytanoyl-CoA dioxygenase family protein [Chloroflexota bacterium]